MYIQIHMNNKQYECRIQALAAQDDAPVPKFDPLARDHNTDSTIEAYILELKTEKRLHT